jgi:hypothetical protein
MPAPLPTTLRTPPTLIFPATWERAIGLGVERHLEQLGPADSAQLANFQTGRGASVEVNTLGVNARLTPHQRACLDLYRKLHKEHLAQRLGS